MIWVFFNAEKYLYLCFLSGLFTFLHEVDQKLCDGVSYDWKITLSRIDHCQNYELHKNVQCLQLVFVRMKLIKKWFYMVWWFMARSRNHVFIVKRIWTYFFYNYKALVVLGISELFLFNLMCIHRLSEWIFLRPWLFNVFSVLLFAI